jgi:hypothetical protein
LKQNLDYVNDWMHTMDSGTGRVGLAQLLQFGFPDQDKWKYISKVPAGVFPTYSHNLDDSFKVRISPCFSSWLPRQIFVTT